MTDGPSASTDTQDADQTAYMALKEDNMRRWKKLAGKGLTFAPAQITNIQLEALFDLLGEDAKKAWGMLFETRMADLMDEAEVQAEAAVSRTKLLDGVQTRPSGLIV